MGIKLQWVHKIRSGKEYERLMNHQNIQLCEYIYTYIFEKEYLYNSIIVKVGALFFKRSLSLMSQVITSIM